MAEADKDLDSYLARIRKTIADSKNLVSQAKLRMAETDRMLEKQGLTREQVMQMHFSEAQMEAVNAELKRRGMDPLERWGAAGLTENEPAAEPQNVFHEPSPDGELAERQRKFGMMMKPFHI